MSDAEKWAAGIRDPAYAIDDDTAIQVVDGTVEVVSEGSWRLFARPPGSKRTGLEGNALLGWASVRECRRSVSLVCAEFA